jgi:hypothetical protein
MLLYGNRGLLLFEKTKRPENKGFLFARRQEEEMYTMTKRKRQKMKGGYNPLLNFRVELFRCNFSSHFCSVRTVLCSLQRDIPK